jgi:hypothetical protein
MVTEPEARRIAARQMPEGSRIIKVVEHEAYYILLIHWPDPLEGHLDPFFSVHKQTGAFSDFDLERGGRELIRQFL